MKCFFSLGANLLVNGQSKTVVRQLENNRFQLEDQTSHAIETHTQQQLHEWYAEGKLRFPISTEVEGLDPGLIPSAGRPLSAFPDKVQQQALRKKQYLDALQPFGPFISSPVILQERIHWIATQLGDAAPPSPATIYRWHKKCNQQGSDHRQLIDRFDLRGGRASRLHPDVKTILSTSIETVYLAKQRNSARAVFADMGNAIRLANAKRLPQEQLSRPSYATVCRALKALDRYLVDSNRYGKEYARAAYRTSGKGMVVAGILVRVEIDHTPLDLFVIDERTGLPLGRPTVTVATDYYSKMPIGFYLGFDGPSLEAVYACLRHAVLPKHYIRTEFPDIENEWPCYGVMDELVCDNGLEFHAKALERTAFELDFILAFCPKKQPYYKGSIERFLKTLNFQFAHAMPGTSFARWFHREDYDPLKDAVVNFDQLNYLLHRWIVDVYAHSPHRGIMTTAFKRWQEGMAEREPALPPEVERLDLAISYCCERTLTHAGIELNNLRYNSPVLLPIRHHLGKKVKVQVRYSKQDLTYIHVLDPVTQAAIPVPAVDQEYVHGLTLIQHNLIWKHLRRVMEEDRSKSSLLRAKAELRALVQEMSLSKSVRQRQKSAKIRSIGQDRQDWLDTPEPPKQKKATSPAPFTPAVSDAAELPELDSLVLPAARNTEARHGR